MFLLLPDQQGCLQRRFPAGQFSFPSSSLPRRALHNHRHRSVCRGGGSADRLSLQRGPRIGATCTSVPPWPPALLGSSFPAEHRAPVLARAACMAGPQLGCPAQALSPYRQTVDPRSPRGCGVPPSDSMELGTSLAAGTRRSTFACWKTCRRDAACCCWAGAITSAPGSWLPLPAPQPGDPPLVPRLGP